MTYIDLRSYTAAEARPLVDQLVDMYVNDVYADDPVFSDETHFRDQITSHMTRPGWELVTATTDGQIVGYIYGFTLTADTNWWRGLVTDVPEGFAVEDGRRTLAISELLVREPWRRHLIATVLHDTLLDGRTEQRISLLVQPSYAAAQAAYANWGYQKVAQLQPSWPNAPLYDVLLLSLRES
jgi:hypothetical protein